MKKILVFAAVAALTVGSLTAQNNFRGVITYSVTSTGVQNFDIPAQIANPEIKVYDDKVLTSSPLFASGMADNVLVDGLKQYTCMDLSQLMMYFAQMDIELDYKGSSKILLKHEYKQSDVDSLTIPVTEGFYIEYVDGEPRTIAGVSAKKAIIHAFNDEGEDNQTVIWYNDEMGPAVNFLFNGIRGVALEYAMNLGEGRQITLSANEIKKGKVKEVDMLLPSGYEELNEEQAKRLFEQIQEELEYLQDAD